MCHRFAPLTLDELEEALASRGRGGRAAFCARDVAPDAYPGSSVPVAMPTYDAGLQAAVLTWGFTTASTSKRIFNTRLDTALEQARTGRGLWAQAMLHGRCLVPARAFYEPSSTETVASSRTGKPIKRAYRFTLAGSGVFLLAGIAQDGRFSIVTTAPNRWVAPVHNRMPLVLRPGESSAWLAGDFEALANRESVELDAQGE